jgi:thiol-disulfide isomerase/thioredoxin
MSLMKTSQIAIFVILICVFSFISYCKKPAKASDLPEIQLKDLNGATVELSQFRGKPVIINFWATWCGPCRFEIPMLNELHKKYSPRGLVIVGISTDEEGASIVKPFMKELPIEYSSLLKGKDTEEKFGGVWALPTTIFFDKNGKQVDKILGVQPREVFEQKIQQML